MSAFVGMSGGLSSSSVGERIPCGILSKDGRDDRLLSILCRIRHNSVTNVAISLKKPKTLSNWCGNLRFSTRCEDYFATNADFLADSVESLIFLSRFWGKVLQFDRVGMCQCRILNRNVVSGGNATEYGIIRHSSCLI